MTTARETALQALDLLLKTALQAVSPPVEYMLRNGGIAKKIEEGEDITVSGPAKVYACLKDGDAAEPDALLGGDIYDHVQATVLELAALHPDADKRDEAMDAAIAAIAAALKNDPALGGACDWAQPQPPDFSTIGDPDAPMGKAAEIGIEVLFTADTSIG